MAWISLLIYPSSQTNTVSTVDGHPLSRNSGTMEDGNTNIMLRPGFPKVRAENSLLRPLGVNEPREEQARYRVADKNNHGPVCR